MKMHERSNSAPADAKLGESLRPINEAVTKAIMRTNDHIQHAIYEYATEHRRQDIIDKLYDEIKPGELPSPEVFNNDEEAAAIIINRAEEIAKTYRAARQKKAHKQIARHSLKHFISGMTFGAYAPALLDMPDEPLRHWLPNGTTE